MGVTVDCGRSFTNNPDLAAYADRLASFMEPESERAAACVGPLSNDKGIAIGAIAVGALALFAPRLMRRRNPAVTTSQHSAGSIDAR